MSGSILDTGISVVYEPEGHEPLVDILFVHGFQGHPYKTWTRSIDSNVEQSAIAEQSVVSDISTVSELLSVSEISSVKATDKRNNVLQRVATRLRRSKRPRVDIASQCGGKKHVAPSTKVFWPGELLPKECPNSRILVFGYDSKVTKYRAGEINENTVFSHAKDLLYSLARERKVDCPLVCVAHSLGGIIVKEMLARSSSSRTRTQNIVKSTAAVMFLGTPHRGSPEVAGLGEIMRSLVSALGMETAPTLLDALALKTSDLERAQEEFSRVWEIYDFRLKTFQEGLSFARIGKKVVPDYSSLIGDHREDAETLQANHLEMCRFSGPDDPNYRKVIGEIRSLYRSVTRLDSKGILSSGQGRQYRTPNLSVVSEKSRDFGPCYEKILQTLSFPTMRSRYQSLHRPAEGTCNWLFEHSSYRNWYNGQDRQTNCGLLWLKGKPGAGKSILMKEACRRAAEDRFKSEFRIARFFFSANGEKLEHSTAGMFRSLLFQLLDETTDAIRHLKATYWEYRSQYAWHESEARDMFESMVMDQTERKTLIFIDGLDECSGNVRDLAYFWRSITRAAHSRDIDFNVCLSSRHFPVIAVSECSEIIIEQYNEQDIGTYVDRRFELGTIAREPQVMALRDLVLQKSSGVFLWAVLVVNDLLKHWDGGRGVQFLREMLQSVPNELDNLFSNILWSMKPETVQATMSLFQWAILATKPLRLHEWHHIMAFIHQPSLASLKEWRTSVHFIQDDEQLERQIRTLSLGLLEVQTVVDSEQSFDEASICAGAGSLTLGGGESRIVQVIHESVRDFFLQRRGFGAYEENYSYAVSWEQDRARANAAVGHRYIMETCFKYLNLSELDALVEARLLVRPAPNDGSDSTQSFPVKRSNSVSEIQDLSSFEKLQANSLASGIDIDEWMSSNSAPDAECQMMSCASSSRATDTARSQILEDYPALLSYCLFNVFEHAKSTQGLSGGDLHTVLSADTWNRWVILREDLPPDISLSDYLVEQGLEARAIVLGQSNSQCKEREPQIPGHQKPKRKRSVASFGSASSHG